ncbi:MAG: hypothetical protein JWM35_1666 [Verrucomicrobia bacterium]|nr:hypothetical protein [Verrucomicrobiota bacterium]
MSDFDTEGAPENEWDDRGELAWNEFDWERYLREQDDSIHRYLGFYEAFRQNPNRIDAVAEQMGWAQGNWSDDDDSTESVEEDSAGESPDSDEAEVYTLHKNPIFIATKAIYLSVKRPWELNAGDGTKVPSSIALSVLASIHRGEEQAVQAIHALDFGDYAMAISLFKRALSALNATLALLNADDAKPHRAVMAYREATLPKLFDLREIWLRVTSECREELDRPVDEES